MAVPGLKTTLPVYRNVGHPGSGHHSIIRERTTVLHEPAHTPARRVKQIKPKRQLDAPLWMAHDMEPREPYVGGEHARAVGVAKKGESRGAHAIKAEDPPLAVMLTGGPEFSYKPSKGEPMRRNHKKGYFNDPDLAKYGPRHKFYDSSGQHKPNKRQQVLTRFKQTHQSYPTRHLIKGKDNVWKTREQAELDSVVDMKVRSQFIGDMQRQRQQKNARLAVEAETESNFARVYTKYDPFKPAPPHIMTGNKRTEDIHDDLSTGRVDTIEGFKQPYAGADSIDAAKRSRQRLHKHHNLPGARYDTEENNDQHHEQLKAEEASRRNGLLQQASQTRAERTAAKRLEMYTKETPVIQGLGKSGCGAPNIKKDGSVQMKLCGSLETDIMGGEKIPRNTKLARALEAQIIETEEKGHTDMAYDKHYSLHMASKRWDPFSRPRLASGSYKGRLPFRTDQGELKDNMITEMGKPGGGNPMAGGARRTVNLPDEDYTIELKAQAKGESGWHQAGSGAPNRHADGTDATKLYGAAVMDKNGRTEHVKDPKYMERIAEIKKEQDQFMAEKRANKKMKAVVKKREQDKYAREPKLGEMMAATSDRRHKLSDVHRAHVKDPDPNFDPLAPPTKSPSAKARDRNAGKAYKKAQKERRDRTKKAQKENQVDDVKHIEAEIRTFDTIEAREKEHSKHDRHKDRITKFLAPEMHPNTDAKPEEKRAYAEVLQKDIARISNDRKKFDKRRLKDEAEHMKYNNKFLEKTVPNTSKQGNGELTARRTIPVGAEAQEYRLLCNTAPALE